jgi:HEPN domain-containing protein
MNRLIWLLAQITTGSGGVNIPRRSISELLKNGLKLTGDVSLVNLRERPLIILTNPKYKHSSFQCIILDMMMDEQRRYEYWLETAQYDLDTADAMYESKRWLYVGFMCHLAVEKAFKALIARKGIDVPKSHNLMKLAQLSGAYDNLNENQLELLGKLNPLNIEARYPVYKDKLNAQLDGSVSEELLAETKEAYKWIKNLP